MIDTIRHHMFGLASAGVLLAVMGCGCMQSDEDLKSMLGNKKLVRASNSGGSSSSSEIYFCPNGEYAWLIEGLMTSTGGAGDFSSSSRSVERGKWEISDGNIVLKSSESETSRLPVIGVNGDVMEVGKEKYLIKPHNECQ